MSDLRETLRRIRERRPLVHCVSNIVTANDCANLLLAAGASPMMAQAREEMAEIAAISSACVLNTGTPDAARFELVALRGGLANELGHPCVLDPVGVGASSWRLANLRAALMRFTPTVVRVNLSEARALLGESSGERGVDSSAEATDVQRAEAAEALAGKLRAAVLLSGRTDFASDGAQTRRIDGGSDMISQITGAGCMLSALCGAFAAVEPNPLEAAAQAAAFWKRCAARAEKESGGKGTGSFRAALFDAACSIER